MLRVSIVDKEGLYCALPVVTVRGGECVCLYLFKPAEGVVTITLNTPHNIGKAHHLP